MEGMFGNDGEKLSDTNKGLIHSTFSTNTNWPYDWGQYNQQPPTDILLDNDSIAENEPAGTDIGQFSLPGVDNNQSSPIDSSEEWDFTYGFKHTGQQGADTHLIEQVNLRKYSEWQNPPITYWGPKSNDLDGWMTYKFQFDRKTSEIASLSSPCWDFTKQNGGSVVHHHYWFHSMAKSGPTLKTINCR